MTDDIDVLVDKLDLETKVRLLTGATMWSTGEEHTVGLRPMVLSDGPAGVRGTAWDERDTSVSLPSGTALAATWDEDLAGRVGWLLAAEARRKGVDVVLGPTVNLHRSPLGGRHFECLSEDPLLTGRIAAAYVRGLQDKGVGACPKHFVANDSETDRFNVDVQVGERALRELYLAPFEHIVAEAEPWAIMAGYNAVNGTTMTEHPLLEDVLKGEWGFDGMVVSDWTAVRSTEEAGAAGTDLAMPGPASPWGEALVAAVRAGRVPEAAVDAKVRRILRLAARVEALGGTPAEVPPVDGAALARELAEKGMVLVRNEGVLPLAEGTGRIALLGPNAAEPRTQGGGSAEVHPDRVLSPLDGLREALSAEVVHAVGARVRHGLQPVRPGQVTHPVTGEPGLRFRLLGADGGVVRDELRTGARVVCIGEDLDGVAVVELSAVLHTDQAGEYGVGTAGLGRYTVTVDGADVVDEVILPETGDMAAELLNPPHRSGRVAMAAGGRAAVTVRHEVHTAEDAPIALAIVGMAVEAPHLTDEEEIARAVALARESETAIVVVGTTEEIESEGYDRTTLALPGRQDDLVRAVAAVNPRTIVVVNSGSPVEMPWREEVQAVLLAWFPGQEFGAALAGVLLGRSEPGGRLPTTWPVRMEDVPVLDTTPVDGALGYSEGVHVGYRAWARSAVEPAYAFGHGLGYTTWAYESLEVSGRTATVRVRNTGTRPGREVVQVYLARPESEVDRPELWLAGFASVEAGPGEDAEVVVELPDTAFRHWSDGWRIEPGAYVATAGRSSADRPLAATVTV